jgi:PadR family transcriptional regulator, regulatory protein AphA
MLARRLASLPTSDREKTTAFKKFTYQGLISRAEQEIAWAQQGLALIDELYPGS